MAKLLVLAESGFGKSTSICPNEEFGIKGVNPEETFLINVSINKPLPARGWKKMFKEIEGTDLSTGNYVETNDANGIASLIKVIQSKKPEIKNLIIDDFQYLMADYYMLKAKTSGFEKFQEIGYFTGQIFSAFNSFKGNIIVLSHHEQVETGYTPTYKAKTVGTMVDRYITMEGKFDIVLYGEQSYDAKNKKAVKEFVTNFNGKYPAKSPAGMFELTIPNDMGYVLEKVKEYYEG